MSETTINQRLNFLLQALEMKAGPFSRALGLSETTVRNYLDRNSKPSSDVLEKISNTFSHVNLVWLINGQGDPFLTTDPHPSSTNLNAKKISRNQFVASNQGKAVMNASECEKDLAAAQKDIERLQEQLATKDALLAAKDDIIAAKEEMLALLRGGHNRPN